MAAPSSGLPLPGFGAPSVGFDTPFEMLEACHERVLRTLALQQRLCEHVATKGCDASAQGAARDVLRYFDLAAPLHHEDEELHVFPPLQASREPGLRAAVAQLREDHVLMAKRWALARTALKALAEGSATEFSAAQADALAAFADGYAEHIRIEESVVYPAARAVLDAHALRAMAQDMKRRRGAQE